MNKLALSAVLGLAAIAATPQGALAAASVSISTSQSVSSSGDNPCTSKPPVVDAKGRGVGTPFPGGAIFREINGDCYQLLNVLRQSGLQTSTPVFYYTYLQCAGPALMQDPGWLVKQSFFDGRYIWGTTDFETFDWQSYSYVDSNGTHCANYGAVCGTTGNQPCTATGGEAKIIEEPKLTAPFHLLAQ